MISQIRDRFGLNTLIGILLLVALFSLAGDDVIALIARQVPGRGINEAPPCRWLPEPVDLANHQSLIARSAISRGRALELEVRTSPIPADENGRLTIRILVTNETLGTVPFIYDPDAVIVGDNNTSGLGIIFSPASNIVTPGINRTDSATFPENNVRILGPQQRCIHVMEFTRNQLDQNIQSGNATVQAYYRGNGTGVVQAASPTPIYPDQGLPTGLTLSNPVSIPAS